MSIFPIVIYAIIGICFFAVIVYLGLNATKIKGWFGEKNISNRLEKLVGNLDGFYSIRINDQWRIVFKFENGGAENVRITDYH
ncbi:type II toxin-antitoxin system RelE/ParE family toxin [Treponema parvum]|uniref:type II toxin-antitoxin system RelE/ParE family toxin n=1 Tax=Treponema parvum TaxID=138851 RepID=UPI001FE480FE|nr:type II toxin-antitoxin system RelE/ParE family toxin [Treponema parvum]